MITNNTIKPRFIDDGAPLCCLVWIDWVYFALFDRVFCFPIWLLQIDIIPYNDE